MQGTLIGEDHVAEVVESVFSAMLSLPISRGRDHSAVCGSAQVASAVHISGGFSGIVLFLCTESFARRAASIMLETPPADISLSEMHDTVAEISNIIGGGIKSILPGPSVLSLPTVTHGSDYHMHVPRTVRLAHLELTCHDEPLQVRILESNTGGAA